MNSMNKWILTGIISVASAGLCAQAQDAAAPGKQGPRGDHKGPHAQMLERFDTNKDGVISAEEKAAMPERAQKRYDAFMAKTDTNKDGKLDDGERAAAMKAHHAEILAKFDTNKDGKLDETEKTAIKAAMDARRAEGKEGKEGKAGKENKDGKDGKDGKRGGQRGEGRTAPQGPAGRR